MNNPICRAGTHSVFTRRENPEEEAMKSFLFNDGAARRKKLQAFEALAFEHIDALYRAALRLTRNRQDAEDLVQDAYLRAFRFFDRFQPGTNFKAWLFTILRNTFINHYRKKKIQPATLAFDKVAFMLSDTDARVPASRYVDRYDETRYQDMFGDQIQAALDRLPEEFRMVVLLADIEEFQYQEIAEIMNCPIGTVMSRLSRARRQLQRYLRDYAYREGYVGRTIGLREKMAA
ncbi:sigma-70 family RNA polymerase sigma factor [candidate division KSB1 bacterium]|nr:sigma-70 family RNA polymerase sigma factor [candidate division KSB1 bacterium]